MLTLEKSDTIKNKDYRIHDNLHYFKHFVKNANFFDIPNSYLLFAFVRNPFSKLVSFFEDEGKFVKNSKYAIRDLNYWLITDKFEEFVYKVCSIPDIYSERHFVSQNIFLYDDEGRKLFTYLGRFENLVEDYEHIKKSFNLLDLPHFQKRKVKKKEDYKNYYTVELAKLVYKRYKKDVHLLGYYQNYLELLKYCKEQRKLGYPKLVRTRQAKSSDKNE